MLQQYEPYNGASNAGPDKNKLQGCASRGDPVVDLLPFTLKIHAGGASTYAEFVHSDCGLSRQTCSKALAAALEVLKQRASGTSWTVPEANVPKTVADCLR